MESGAEAVVNLVFTAAIDLAKEVDRNAFIIRKKQQHIQAQITTAGNGPDRFLNFNGHPDSVVFRCDITTRGQLSPQVSSNAPLNLFVLDAILGARGIKDVRDVCSNALSDGHLIDALTVEIKSTARNLLAKATAQVVAGCLAYTHGGL